MFTDSAAVYDAIYESFHDFPAEAAMVDAHIQRHKRSPGNTLLDVACGTGLYLGPLSQRYDVEGLDLDAGMLAVARERLPGVPLHHADMIDFDLGRRFDAVVCLGSSIGYAKTLPKMRETVRTLARHTIAGGVVVIEPWFTPDHWDPGRTTALLVDRPDLKVARISHSRERDGVALLDFHYLFTTADGVRHAVEHHALGLFTHAGYLAAFQDAGLTVTHDPTGLIGRGLYLGVVPITS